MVCKKVMSPDYLLQLTFSVFSVGKSQQLRSPTEAAEPGRGRAGPESSKLHLSPLALHKPRGRNEHGSRAGRFPATSRRCRRHPPPPPNREHPRLPPRSLRSSLCRSGAAAGPRSAGGEGRGSHRCLSYTPEGGPAGRVPQPAPLPPASAGPAPLPPAPSRCNSPQPEARSAPTPPRAAPRSRPGAAPTSAVS